MLSSNPRTQETPDSFCCTGGSSTEENPLSRPQTIRVRAAEDSSTAHVSRRMAPGFGYVRSFRACPALPTKSFSCEMPAAVPSTRRATPCREQNTIICLQWAFREPHNLYLAGETCHVCVQKISDNSNMKGKWAAKARSIVHTGAWMLQN